MDPLTAFSLATGIVTFVDFGSKLVSQYLEIRQSKNGRPAVLASLEVESQDLSAKATYARDKVTALQELYPGQSQSLTRLAEECTRAEKQLRSLVDSLTAKSGQGLKTISAQAVVSLKGLMKQGEIESLQTRLKNIREHVMMDVIMCISQNITESATTINTLGKGVETVQETLDDVKATIENLQPDFQNISRGRLSSIPETERITSGLWTTIAAAGQVTSQASSDVNAEEVQNHDICNRILEGLKFKDMMAREGQIEQPFPETFQWLLEDQHPESNQPLGFKKWLESTTNETPFWITGSPASGKSTLMKFICTNAEVQKHLSHWAGDRRLLTCNIYFWNPGSIRQKSQAGLLLTLLYQILQQRPYLCQLVARKRYTYFQLAGIDATNPPGWTIEELRDSITQSISKTDTTDCLALFIDGLDEYEGDLRDLIYFLKQLHSDYKIKLCVSSRLWNIFKDEFRVYPSLRMELLTRPDIEKYVHGRMGTSSAIQELRVLEPDSIEKLESGIIEKADGVFLWVVLVVEKLITTAQDNNDLHVIWKEFMALQPGLEELYVSIRRRMDKSLLEGASKMYQLLFCWNEVLDYSISATDFWVAINCHDPTESQDYPTNAKEKGIIPALERRLAGHTGGMLQLRATTPKSISTSVDFLHRTVFDWLQSIRSSVINDGPPEYDPSLILASTLVSRDEQIAAQHVFYFGRACNNSTQSRVHLLGIIGRMPQYELRNCMYDLAYDVIWDLPLPTLRAYVAVSPMGGGPA
ncbi:P-loop containing nucleoside triphosphate hydrolase [Fusarium austroafricanum]|uniref:P-loop containing nucleoside triphosphate hydrolase n=1 Tax=Fusarium austroafricanum TaxID=2364996 RepID=A0A8H4KMV2_9HYPO|nr:P-loop containing nucleoside triphosphate hydrolase [Fusarium austroafricanum]